MEKGLKSHCHKINFEILSKCLLNYCLLMGSRTVQKFPYEFPRTQKVPRISEVKVSLKIPKKSENLYP